MISDHQLTVNSTTQMLSGSLQSGEGLVYYGHSEITAANSRWMSVKHSERPMTAPYQGGSAFISEQRITPVYLYYIPVLSGPSNVAGLMLERSDYAGSSASDSQLLTIPPEATTPGSIVVYWRLRPDQKYAFIRVYPKATETTPGTPNTMSGYFIASMTYDEKQMRDVGQAFYMGEI